MTPSGASVRIREAPPTENDACLSPNSFDSDFDYCKFTLFKTPVITNLSYINSSVPIKMADISNVWTSSETNSICFIPNYYVIKALGCLYPIPNDSHLSAIGNQIFG